MLSVAAFIAGKRKVTFIIAHCLRRRGRQVSSVRAPGNDVDPLSPRASEGGRERDISAERESFSALFPLYLYECLYTEAFISIISRYEKKRIYTRRRGGV